jgi:hypothetical protein
VGATTRRSFPVTIDHRSLACPEADPVPREKQASTLFLTVVNQRLDIPLQAFAVWIS